MLDSKRGRTGRGRKNILRKRRGQVFEREEKNVKGREGGGGKLWFRGCNGKRSRGDDPTLERRK